VVYEVYDVVYEVVYEEVYVMMEYVHVRLYMNS
jgi:hypothetical protein